MRLAAGDPPHRLTAVAGTAGLPLARARERWDRAIPPRDEGGTAARWAADREVPVELPPGDHHAAYLLHGAAHGAGLAAELAPGDAPPRVYLVEPTGAIEDDSNLDDKKFPGNPTRSYRSTDPLRVLREVDDWTQLTPDALAQWRRRLAAMDPDAEFIN